MSAGKKLISATNNDDTQNIQNIFKLNFMRLFKIFTEHK
jgi:hypothetical protein